MPVERQRWVPVADWPALNARLTRTADVLDTSDRWDVREVSATTTLGLTYPLTLVLVTTTGGSVTLTLPPAASVAGFRLEVKKLTAANTVTLDAHASETIDGAATFAWTTQYQSFGLIAANGGWHVV